MRVNLQPAYLLHSRPYRDSGQLLEVMCAEYGRLGLVGRGVHRRARGGSLRATLQPFRPLLLSFSGRGELMTLTAAESAGPAPPLRGECLFSGLYLNELLLRLLQRHDPHPALFACYGETLERLASGEAAEVALRRFELRLLDELGYGFDPALDADRQEQVREQTHYVYREGSGLVAMPCGAAAGERSYRGVDLRAIAAGDFTGSAGASAKRLLRQVLAEHLGERPLQTRELFRQYRQAEEPKQ